MNKKAWLVAGFIVVAVFIIVRFVLPTMWWNNFIGDNTGLDVAILGDRVTEEAVAKNDPAICMRIPETQFGDLSSRFYCVVSVLKTADFCNDLTKEGWDKRDHENYDYQYEYDRNECFFSAALFLEDSSLCANITQYPNPVQERLSGAGRCKGLVEGKDPLEENPIRPEELEY